MRIAHISDLHFSKVSFQLNQFSSKRWLGNLNLLFSRKKAFDQDRLFELIPFFKAQKINHLIITGDLTTTSLNSEFDQALQFVKRVEEAEIKVWVLPGNHDHYTKQAYRQKRFYHYFPSDLKEEGVFRIILKKGWWLVGLDTALATSLLSSRGDFNPLLQEKLTQILDDIPKSDKIIMANHFSLFENDGPRKILLRSDSLKNLLLKYPHILFYLHGHSHRHSVADLRPNGLPIILDSGSVSHKQNGSWHLLDISQNECQLDIFNYCPESAWQASKRFTFGWST